MDSMGLVQTSVLACWVSVEMLVTVRVGGIAASAECGGCVSSEGDCVGVAVGVGGDRGVHRVCGGHWVEMGENDAKGEFLLVMKILGIRILHFMAGIRKI